MLDLRPIPANVSSTAAAKLPRFLLMALLILFIVPGLFDRAVWTVREGAAFGQFWEMAHGDFVSWLFPMASGLVITDHGPLSIWAGAILMRLQGNEFTPVVAARITACLWFAITTASIWYGTWYLARRKEAQPLGTIFADQATYRDYGRMVADAATLFFIALFGLVIRLREPTYDSAELAFCSLAFFSCAWALTRPYFGAALAGVACAGLMLTASLILGIAALLACLFSFLMLPTRGKTDKKLIITLAVTVLLFSLWPLAAWVTSSEVISDYFLLWAQKQVEYFGFLSFEELDWFVRHVLWYLCPVWPFAILGFVKWRKHKTAPFMALPVVFLSVWFVGFLVSGSLNAEDLLNLIIAPLCTVAAFGLISAKRSFQSMLDGFALTITTLGLLGVWAYWLAWLMGFPPKMAKSIINLAPTAQASEAGFLGILLALTATVAWCWIGYKRLQRRSPVLWNGPWLSAVGMVVLWIVVVNLFTQAVNENRSYEPVGQAVRAQLDKLGFQPDDCLKTVGTSQGVASLISYYGHMPVTAGKSMVCRFELLRFDVDDKKYQPLLKDRAKDIIKRPRTDERFIVRRFYPGSFFFIESGNPQRL